MLYSLLFALVLVSSASGQAPPAELPTYQVLRTDQGIQVDGRLDEADWQHAAPIAFVMPWSDLKNEEPQSTTARLLWDDDNLYIIYECVDPYLHAEVTEHDGAVYQEDAVEIFAAPNAAVPGNYYGYEMNINGTLLDYIAFAAARSAPRPFTRLGRARAWSLPQPTTVRSTTTRTLTKAGSSKSPSPSTTSATWMAKSPPRRRPMARRPQPHQGLPRPIWAVVRYRHPPSRLPPRQPVRHPHLLGRHCRPLKNCGARRKQLFHGCAAYATNDRKPERLAR